MIEHLEPIAAEVHKYVQYKPLRGTFFQRNQSRWTQIIISKLVNLKGDNNIKLVCYDNELDWGRFKKVCFFKISTVFLTDF